MVTRTVLPLLREARAGDLGAQLRLGRVYLTGGEGLKRDSVAAFYWLRRAAAAGNAEAQGLMAHGVPPSMVDDPAAVAPFYEAAASRGSANACLALSDWTLGGNVPGRDRRARELLYRSAEGGDRRAQLRVAALLQSEACAPGGQSEALRWFEMAARQGSRAARVALADWFWREDDPAAKPWLEALAEGGDPEVLYRLGVLLLSTGGMRRAAECLGRAALGGHPGAQTAYGLLHAAPGGRRVLGVPHSFKKAAFWLEKASSSGDAQASFQLHRLYRLSQFSLRSLAMSQRYLERSAEQGHPHAQYLVALSLLRVSVERDADLAAARWLIRARSGGHAPAQSLLKFLCPRPAAVSSLAGAERSRVIALIAASRIALATRLELGQVFGLTVPQMLLFTPPREHAGECFVVDIRDQTPRAKRRLVLVETSGERSLMDRACRLLAPENRHPTDVGGTLRQRRHDLEKTLAAGGAAPRLFEFDGTPDADRAAAPAHER